MTQPEIPIKTSELPYEGGRTIFELESDHGFLDAVFDPTTGWLGIVNVDVDASFRCQGIGKMMLRISLELARKQNVNLIYAAIVSRECLDAMQSVFGPDAINVDSVGPYLEPGATESFGTHAVLWFKL